MKKTFTIVLAILCVLCVFSFCACEKTADNTESETGSKTIIGYIDECRDGVLTFDEIEWVNVPSERATELGITDDKAPNGFYIYNEDTATAEYDIADNCVIRFLDWDDNFTPKQIELAGFNDILDQRSGVSVPYTLTIENGKVIGIEEHYVP